MFARILFLNFEKRDGGTKTAFFLIIWANNKVRKTTKDIKKKEHTILNIL